MKNLILAILLSVSTAWAVDQSTLESIDALDSSWKMNECLQQCDAAVELDNADFELLWRQVRAQVNVAEEAMDRGDKDEAEALFGVALASSKQLIELYPNRSMAQYYRALSLGRRAQFAGGREKVELSQGIEQAALKALELDPDNASAHGLIGRYYREMANLSWLLRKVASALYGELPEGGNELALKHLQTAIELKPDWLFARFELAETHAVMDNKDQARKEFGFVVKMEKLDHRDGLLVTQAEEWLAKNK